MEVLDSYVETMSKGQKMKMSTEVKNNDVRGVSVIARVIYRC